MEDIAGKSVIISGLFVLNPVDNAQLKPQRSWSLQSIHDQLMCDDLVRWCHPHPDGYVF